MKKIIDILGIVLPALILLLGMIRLFTKSRKGHNALTMFFAVLLLLIGIIRFLFFADNGSHSAEPKLDPIHVSKHSAIFNQSLESVLNTYYKMTDGFVQNDTVAISKAGTALKLALDDLKIEELHKDTIIYQVVQDPLSNAKTEVSSILADPSMNEKRGSLNILSDNLRNILIIVKYDQAKIYWQECPVAFNDENPGNWLSPTLEVHNPYLGEHSKYEAGSKEYGGPKDTIKFIIADTTKKTIGL